MKCYFDDLCVDEIEIGNSVIISYGVYIACHGRRQGHNKLVIGKGAVIGAGTLVNKSVPDGATCVGVPGRLLDRQER